MSATIKDLVEAGQAIRQAQLQVAESSRAVAEQLGRARREQAAQAPLTEQAQAGGQ